MLTNNLYTRSFSRSKYSTILSILIIIIRPNFSYLREVEMAPLKWPHFFTPTQENRGTILLITTFKFHFSKENLFKCCTRWSHENWSVYYEFFDRKKTGVPLLWKWHFRHRKWSKIKVWVPLLLKWPFLTSQKVSLA